MNKLLYVITASAMGAEAAQALYDLRWMLVFIAWLTVMNLWIGVSSAHPGRRRQRLTHEGRRACNRLVDYMAYLMSGAVLGLAIFEPLGIADHTATAAAGLALGCVWEIESIVNRVCMNHGTGRPLNVRRMVWRMLKQHFKWVEE